MNKKILLSSLLMLAMLPASAQTLEVSKGEIDCGSVGYEVPITAAFELKNTGSKSLLISDVKASCGCLAVDYPHSAIPAGGDFNVNVTYDARQLGHFYKTAAVYSNGSDQPIYLTMTGVVSAEVRDYTGTYDYTMGNIRLDKVDLEFDDVNRGDNPVQEIHIVNAGTKTCNPNLMHLPSYLTATVTPSQLAPGRSGVILVQLNSQLLRDYGLNKTSVYLAENPGDKVSRETEIGVSSVLLPAFTYANETERAYAPKLELSADEITFDFGSKSKLKDDIYITNRGHSVLKITSLQMFTDGLKVTLGKSELKPGKDTKLKITGYRKELSKVRTQPRVLMITNDPDHPKVVVKINVK
ncbi:MAG: DUF1573 domain-containing protein [Prevotella sp.]|nr:DUF1573 domain-containing protein [Prevotella sp.]